MVIHSVINMFNIFKKKQKKRIQEWEYVLLKSIAEKLPIKYSFLKNQVSSEFILDCMPNDILKNGWKTVLYNQKLCEKYKNKHINYRIINIQVFDEKSNFINISFSVYNGILIGYKIPNYKKIFNIIKIDTSHIKEQSRENIDRKELEKLLNFKDDDILSLLDIDNTFKIEIPEGVFYVIKNLGNGDYLAIDTNGAIYSMIHDPYKIEKLFTDITSFTKALKLSKFNINKYGDNTNGNDTK